MTEPANPLWTTLNSTGSIFVSEFFSNSLIRFKLGIDEEWEDLSKRNDCWILITAGESLAAAAENIARVAIALEKSWVINWIALNKKVPITMVNSIAYLFIWGKKLISACKLEVDLNLLDNIREYKNIADETLLTVQITIFKVSSTGYLNFADKIELKVKYTCEDFRKFHFKLKNLEVLMRLVADSVIKTTSSNGISYKNLLEKINKNK